MSLLRIKTAFLVVVATSTIVTWGVLYIDKIHKNTNYAQTRRIQENTPMTMLAWNMSMDHYQRRDFLQRMCQETRHVHAINYTKLSYHQHIFANKKYNFAVCVVPKSGCSFMKQLVLYLSDPDDWVRSNILYKSGMNINERIRYGMRLQNRLFNIPRVDVHSLLDFDPFVISLDEFHDIYSTKVMLTRNPYSRLYSAYIDKVYIPMLWTLITKWYMTKMERKPFFENINECNAKFITFEEFLENVISDAQTTFSNMHWVPVTTLCNPCDTKPDIIIKQETYYDDVKYLLKTLNIAEKEREYLDDVIGKHGVQSSATVRGLIETMYMNVMTKSANSDGVTWINPCFTKMNMVRRIWEALKIQGHIYNNNPFPFNKLASNPVFSNTIVVPTDTNFIADVILSEMEKMPITVEESRVQRQRALVRAYRNVRQDIILQIQAIYYHDFAIFGYDFQPPR